ncbi:MAG: hypothetical protein ACXWN8_18745, partial [Isosphaeraceae bacterium]
MPTRTSHATSLKRKRRAFQYRKNGTGSSPTARRLSRRPEPAKEHEAAIVAGFPGRRSLFLLELDVDDVFGLLG